MMQDDALYMQTSAVTYDRECLSHADFLNIIIGFYKNSTVGQLRDQPQLVCNFYKN